MSNSAVKKMEDEATRSGYKSLISAMNKLTSGKKADEPVKKKAAAKKKEAKEPKEKSPDVPDELRDTIRGFFQKKKAEDKEAVDLYVGSKGMKKPEKKKRRSPGSPKPRRK